MRLLLCRLALRYTVLVLRVAEFFLKLELRTRRPEHDATDWDELRARVAALRKKQARVQELLSQVRP